MARLGFLAVGFYLAHGTFHLMHGRPHDLLWACHLGAALVGIGLLVTSATVNGIGTLFLCMGTPLWLLDLAGGAAFLPTSCLAHLGGLFIGLYGIKRIGFSPGTWWKATATLALIIALSRLLTPPSANVNVAFSVQRGWESLFSSHLAYLAIIMLIAAAFFFLVEHTTRRWLLPEPATEPGT